jgi:hypothetical protein
VRDIYGAAAARRARDEFSINTMVNRTLELYREVVVNGRIGAASTL